jgi:hypothetical protein
MTTRTTKEMAEEVLESLKSAHEDKPWFKKAVLETSDLGYGVDLWVDREKFRARTDKFMPPGAINHVVVCVMVQG